LRESLGQNLVPRHAGGQGEARDGLTLLSSYDRKSQSKALVLAGDDRRVLSQQLSKK
jgi:hypothetical protein